MRSTSDVITDPLSVLRAAGFRVESSDSLADLVLVLPGGRALPVRMKASVASPTPSAVKKLVDTRRERQRGVKLLLVVAHANRCPSFVDMRAPVRNASLRYDIARTLFVRSSVVLAEPNPEGEE